MSAAFAPEMPDTRTIAPSSTYDRPPLTWPIRLARKSTICFAMPVTSISPPRKTNSGTASRIRCDIPSSMRPTTTDDGTPVVSTMKPSVARPNENAIGMPDSTIAPTPAMKNSTRFQRPSVANADGATCATASSAATTAAAPAATTSVRLHDPRSASCSSAKTIIRPIPIGSAAARHALAISSAGVVMSISPRA